MNKKILFVNILVLSMAGVAVFAYFAYYEPATVKNNACLEIVNMAAIEYAEPYDWSNFDYSWDVRSCSDIMDKEEMQEKIRTHGATFSSDDLDFLIDEFVKP